MIIFMDEMICITTGGDMEEAYAALWELPRMWLIISCGIKHRENMIPSNNNNIEQ